MSMMEKAKEAYYKFKDVDGGVSADDYIKELEQQNKEMLNELVKIYFLEDDEYYDFGKLRELILKIKRKSIEEAPSE